MASLHDIALRFRRHIDSNAFALLYTLELTLIKKYDPLAIKEMRQNISDTSKLLTLLNQSFKKLKLPHNPSTIPNLPIRSILKQLFSADISIGAVSELVQRFTIERYRNDLFSYSTPQQLRELMVRLMNLQDSESIYNPCFGIGGFFIEIAKSSKSVQIFAEEKERINQLIAGLIAQLCGIKKCKLHVTDTIAHPAFCVQDACQKFDKALCNPPLHESINTAPLQKDWRFAKYGLPPANASELFFMIHLLHSFKKRAIILIRESLLKRGQEAKIRIKIAFDGLIEAIVSLPRGIVPHTKEDLALIVLSKDNKDILFVDANRPYFNKRRGKRNTIYRVKELAEIVLKRQKSKYSTLVPLQEISAISLSPSFYLKATNHDPNLQEIATIFRAQRVAVTNGIPYQEIAIKDIVPNGYTSKSQTIKRADPKKAAKFRLQNLDILLPLRGSPTSIGIVKTSHLLIPNAGIIVIRTKKSEEACCLYLYLRSAKGQQELQRLYDTAPNKTLSPSILQTLKIPENLGTNCKERVERIFTYQKQIDKLKEKIEKELL